jgi:hypothetical protein
MTDPSDASGVPSFVWGAIGAVISWPLVEFVGKPFRQFFDIRRQVARCLVDYGNVAARSSIDQSGEWKKLDPSKEEDDRLIEAQQAFRGLAADMRAFANGEPAANWAVRFFGYGYDTDEIADALLSLEANLPTKGIALHEARNKVERLLGVRATKNDPIQRVPERQDCRP